MKKYFPKDELFEKLASIEHERWGDWMKYMFSKELVPIEGDTVMPKDNCDRWRKQMITDYKDLSEQEKDSNREQVMRYWHLISLQK